MHIHMEANMFTGNYVMWPQVQHNFPAYKFLAEFKIYQTDKRLCTQILGLHNALLRTFANKHFSTAGEPT